MKKLLKLLVILFIAKASFSQTASLGVQYSFPSYGLSAKFNPNDHHSIQLIYGALGIVSNFSGRYNYLFDENDAIVPTKPYLYAQAGKWFYNQGNLDESVFGYGVGAGLEFNYFFWGLFSDNLKSSIEIGYGDVDLFYYDFSYTTFGFGLHYEFGY